ncbi:hypothetical protein B1H58_14750 [Pantoea alhagi]|uniref:Uncharacterized protein n=1 Tax=Pantoea alhagi TaxID=1891675 RepID=A0A1W6B7Z0_9GAMM|nr:hypothetical protein B1H58_14750 [Pantoea alhagi]
MLQKLMKNCWRAWRKVQTSKLLQYLKVCSRLKSLSAPDCELTALKLFAGLISGQTKKTL